MDAECTLPKNQGTSSSSDVVNSVRALLPSCPCFSRQSSFRHTTDWFDVLDDQNRPLLTERDILLNLRAIVSDADKTPRQAVARNAIGVLSTENRRTWSSLRSQLQKDRHNAGCLEVVDDALFVICLDDASPEGLGELCSNFLCGTYELSAGVQVGTCTNRWYDKVRATVFLTYQILKLLTLDCSFKSSYAPTALPE